ncbi:MAG: hypothetical protein FWF49_03280 [Oscillospiraceae bacterium]|nr:hypothetical protein [Oscillospiraceae bacterium]
MELYTVLYQGINLYKYSMTEEEKSFTENLRGECMKICDELHIPRHKCKNGSVYMGRLMDTAEFCMRYNYEIGYYVLIGERSIFSLEEGFPEPDREKAKFRLLTDEFKTGGFEYELQNRNKLERLWGKTYKEKYDSRKAAFEFTIQKCREAELSFTEEMIHQYTEYMNKWFETPHWVFNRETMVFEETPPAA